MPSRYDADAKNIACMLRSVVSRQALSLFGAHVMGSAEAESGFGESPASRDAHGKRDSEV